MISSLVFMCVALLISYRAVDEFFQQLTIYRMYISICFMCGINITMIFASIIIYICMKVNAFIIYKSFLSQCLSPDSLFLERDSQVSEVRLPVVGGMSPGETQSLGRKYSSLFPLANRIVHFYLETRKSVRSGFLLRTGCRLDLKI